MSSIAYGLGMGLLAACCALAGCTETRFQAPPGDNIETCDVRWKGLWGPRDEADSASAFYVDDECQFIFLDQPEKGGPFKQFHIPVNFVHADGNDYIVVADTALRGLVKIKPVYGVDPVPEKAFYFARYHADRDHLDLYPVDNERVAKQIIDRKLDGTVSKVPNELHVFVSGDRAYMLEILRHGAIFADKPDIRMTRLQQSVDDFERTTIQSQQNGRK
ncbi:MAG: hypothetical protein P4L92_02550 [Rudaea sp.]|nr:hypothetical protein [Rudaea sp.]